MPTNSPPCLPFQSGKGIGRQSPGTGPISSSAESQFLATYCKGTSATAVPTGSEAEARAYYQSLGTSIGLTLSIPPPGKSTPASKLSARTLFQLSRVRDLLRRPVLASGEMTRP